MAHRGRLNVLANIMGKNPRQIFTEFADKDPLALLGRGDVKYHLGYSSDLVSPNGHSMHLSLCFSKSLGVRKNPVAMGRTRAKQDRRQDFDRRRMLCIQIHGDSAFAGEGVVQETLNLSELDDANRRNASLSSLTIKSVLRRPRPRAFMYLCHRCWQDAANSNFSCQRRTPGSSRTGSKAGHGVPTYLR